jgi:hypothetical protein
MLFQTLFLRLQNLNIFSIFITHLEMTCAFAFMLRVVPPVSMLFCSSLFFIMFFNGMGGLKCHIQIEKEGILHIESQLAFNQSKIGERPFVERLTGFAGEELIHTNHSKIRMAQRDIMWSIVVSHTPGELNWVHDPAVLLIGWRA